MDAQSRQEYVKAAVSFLQNPKLIDSPLKEKLTFLRDKGLSDLEVDEALNLALSHKHQTQGGKWNFLLILGICVGGYKLYQAYLEQKRLKEESTSQEVRAEAGQLNLCNLLENKSDKSADKDHPTLQEIMSQLKDLRNILDNQRCNFKNDMQSLKTLLLGHEKFAAPPKIPEWQMPVTDKSSKETHPATEPVKQKTSGKKNKNSKNKDDTTDATSKQAKSDTDGIIEPIESTGPNPELLQSVSTVVAKRDTLVA